MTPPRSEAWRLTACEGKERFPTYSAAEQTLKRHRSKKTRLNVYRCRDCNSFHVGARSPRSAERASACPWREAGMRLRDKSPASDHRAPRSLYDR
jgi:hypothetical protein